MEMLNEPNYLIKNVIWIDQNNDKSENKGYLKHYSERLKDFSFTLVTSVKEGYSCLSKFKFKLVYVILSGRLAEEFLDIYEENLQKLTILTLNIIFCFNGEYYKTKKYANDPFYNPGGVVTEFEEVIKFLTKEDNLSQKPNMNERNKIYNYDNSRAFIFIPKKIENISLPIIFKKFSYRFMDEYELEEFKNFIYNNYSKGTDIEELNFFNVKLKIPYYLYSKIFIRLYTMETPFYRDLNFSLSNGNYSEFNQYIFTLYYGLNRKILKDCHEIFLYRSTCINKNEYDNIIKSSCRIVLTNIFMSFTKNKKIALTFMQTNSKLKNPNLQSILFIVNPLTQKNATVTNIETEEFSYFELEKEVLFLPFSGFEIVKIEEGKEYTTMYLNYLNKYEKKVMDYIDARSKDRAEDFTKELLKQSQSSIFKEIISDKRFKLIEDYRNKKNVLWIDQYSRCKVYDNYLNNYSAQLKKFYFERATTINEAYSILSNYEFKMTYIIINDKLSEKFFSEYINEIKKLGVVTANIIFCDNDSKCINKFLNDPFINPGKIVKDFSKVVNYLNADECGFNKILLMNKTIDRSFAGKYYGNIFKDINENEISIPNKKINKIVLNLPSKEAINVFKNFIYKYGSNLLSKVVNPSQEKLIDLPLFIYPKFYMRMYGLETDFYYDINKYLTNQENDFGIFNTFVTILYYGLSEKLLICNDEFPFYRGGVISKKEFTIIESNYKSNKNFYYCKNFLSFSKELDEANIFLSRNLGCDNSLYPTKFIIEKNLSGDNLMSNVEMRHYSGIATEQEVLFLPLSSFKVTKIEESLFKNKKIKIIKLDYVGIYNKP